jgi:hypothetical protein
MAVGYIVVANGCTGCEKMEAEQEEEQLDVMEEDEGLSPDERMSHDLGTLIVRVVQ